MVTESFTRAEVLSRIIDSTVLALTEKQVVRYIMAKYHDDDKFNEWSLLFNSRD